MGCIASSVMPRFKRGIQYSVSPVCFTVGAAAYWIARSGRAMTLRRNGLVRRVCWYRIEPALDDLGARGGRGEKLDQRLAGVGLLGDAGDACGEHRDLLQFVRQRADDVD